MRVAIISSFDLDGGAAIAAYRLHRTLIGAGLESRLFVQVKSSSDPTVDGPVGGAEKSIARLRPHVDHLPARMAGALLGEFSVNWLPGNVLARALAWKPDVVHFHSMHGGLLSVAQLARLRLPFAWTAHDMWPFTGGCHYDRGCERFAGKECHPCPLTPGVAGRSLAKVALNRKQQAVAAGRMAFITPSRWLASVAERSSVASGSPIHVVPNGLNLNRFKPIDKQAARRLFSLPADAQIVLFGAVNARSDPRKGFALLDQALATASARGETNGVVLCVFGSGTREIGTLHGLPAHFLGHFHDEESLIALYSAADLFVAPSLQDNLPNTVLEASACGLPTIGFAIGGMPDLVCHGTSGLLAPEVSADALMGVMLQALSDPTWLGNAAVAARAHAESNFDERRSLASHIAVYESLIHIGVK